MMCDSLYIRSETHDVVTDTVKDGKLRAFLAKTSFVFFTECHHQHLGRKACEENLNPGSSLTQRAQASLLNA